MSMNANNPMTPGVYTVEKSAFPPSVVGAPTAVPAFVGYTQSATRNGKSIHMQPTFITSLADYHLYFGGAPETKYPIVAVTGIGGAPPKPNMYDFQYGAGYYKVEQATVSRFYLYNSLLTYFMNGGAGCYIVSVGTYLAYDPITKGDAPASVDKPDLEQGLATLELVPFPKPTLLLIPDLMALESPEDAFAVSTEMLNQCADLQDRMAVLDIPQGDQPTENGVVQAFRNGIGINNLNYGMAYYPWMEWDVVDPTQVSFANIDNTGNMVASVGEKSVVMTDLFKGNPVIPTLVQLTTDMDTLEDYIQIPDSKTFGAFHSWSDAFNSGQGAATAVLTTQATVLVEMYETLFDLGSTGKSTLNASLTIKQSDLIGAIALLTNPKGGLATLMVTLAGYDSNMGGKAVVESNLKKWNITATPSNPFTGSPSAAVKFNMAEPFYKVAYSKLNTALNMAVSSAQTLLTSYNNALENSNASYKTMMKAIAKQVNVLPTAAAMAGVICQVDNSTGVWNAPANINLTAAVNPMVSINDAQQAPLNVDALAGKSINVIRSFYGRGPAIIWGARTLDGNSNDWRYINVRRTMIYIEQSVKNAAFSVVFAPNDASTWNTVDGMISGFLRTLWKEGALQGASPGDSYTVQVGLGKTMTPEDILAGIMRVSVKVAIVHPAEFIIITYEQEMAKS